MKRSTDADGSGPWMYAMDGAAAELPADFEIRDFDISTDGPEIVFDRVQVNSDPARTERKCE